ncbi:MAG: universal stress protein [Gammaproteobacteria bacterium]|jgi:universal stress protein A|nr:universal stress protein [Gammaproteobacteria bacterium]
MGIYNSILVAVDLHPSYDEYTAKRATEIAKERGAKLYIIHCVEGIHAYGAAQGYQLIMEVEQQVEQEARKALTALAAKCGIPPEQQIIANGPPQRVVLEQAKNLKVDLIIVGGHGRHGISLLLGSTADGIMHHAECDVLAIRVKDK